MVVHVPVLLQEVVDGLSPKRNETVLDATVGGGGQSEALCRAMEGAGTVVCLDEDEDAILRSRRRLEKCGCKFLFYRTNFRKLGEALASFGIREINRAIFDLGLSSFQIEESGRGFSFQKDEPLRMTFQKEGGELTAEQIINRWDEENIVTIIRSYGEERRARNIAKAIVLARTKKPITTTAELRELIEQTVRRQGKIHPATKTFQAIRIAVNDELGALEEGLRIAWKVLSPGGRIAVISFHSMEDRIVKRFFKEQAKNGSAAVVTKKPIVPGKEEVQANPRARSAKLRIIEKTTFPNVVPVKTGTQ